MMTSMRTTVTLDPEVARLLRESMRRHGLSFKQTLNRAVLDGLSGPEDGTEEPPFEVHSSSMRLRAGLDPAALNRLGDDLEADAFVELTAELVRRDGSR